jgi:cysteinyl-tRNA synthetase
MVDFVKAIANYARVTKGKKNFGVFVQNGEALASRADYVQTVDGIGREDVWYNDNTPNPPSLVNSVTSYLDIFKKAGKLVLVIDYVTEPTLIAMSKKCMPKIVKRFDYTQDLLERR